MVKMNTSSTVPTLWALPAPSGNRSPVYGTFALFFLLNSFLVSAKDQHREDILPILPDWSGHVGGANVSVEFM